MNKLDYTIKSQLCPFCKERLPLYLDKTGKNTIRATICNNPDCHSKVWMDDEEVHGRFRVPFGESDNQPGDE